MFLPQFRAHKTTIAKIFSGMSIYMKVQKQESGWLKICGKSFKRLNFSHYFVAADDKHIYQCITVRPSQSVSVRLGTFCTFFVYPKTNQLFLIFQSRDQFYFHATQTPQGISRKLYVKSTTTKYSAAIDATSSEQSS